jgi:methylmalonyl-CoA mutase N-terminal domain/subunit
VRRCLDALRKAADAPVSEGAGGVPVSGANVLYPMHDALRARATVGEVCNALRESWGVYVPADAF